ncbi:MAG: hypothetical protein AB7V27_12345 [Candidatus Binatia bacterium]
MSFANIARAARGCIGPRRRWSGLAAFIALAGARASACDICSVYTPTDVVYTTTEMREDQIGIYAGLAEQFTAFRTLKRNGETVANPAGERLNSSISQLVLGYDFHPRVGVQLNVPIIARWFRRVTEDGVENGDVSGFGDLSLVLTGKPFSWRSVDSVAHATVLGGLKLPSGDPDEIGEEVEPDRCIPFPDPTACLQRVHVPNHLHPHHQNGAPSGIHGHDLALGSGSVDGIVGAQVFGSWRRLFATASVQYAIRGTGAFDYRYADDLTFDAGPGLYLLTGPDWLGAPYALRAQVLFAGETKGTDSIDGQRVGDTGFTGLYLGPAIGFAWGTRLSAGFAAELPVLTHTTGLQIVPEYRLLGAFTWRF